MANNEKVQALTETRNPRTLYIDRISTREAVKSFIHEDLSIHAAIEACQENIAKATDLAYSSLAKGGRLVYIGAGTSGRLGVLDASECPPTFGVSPDMVIGIIAGGIDFSDLSIKVADARYYVWIFYTTYNRFSNNFGMYFYVYKNYHKLNFLEL